jgi:hypothetical protein
MATLKRLKNKLIQLFPGLKTTNFYQIPLTKPKSHVSLVAVDNNGFFPLNSYTIVPLVSGLIKWPAV